MIVSHINGSVKIINTFFENVRPCYDCRKCHEMKKCVVDDSMSLFYEDILNSDNIIIASPLYYSMLTGSVLNFVSRFQLFFVLKNIAKVDGFSIKRKRGFLVLTGGGATKDFYPVEKVSRLVFRQVNSSFDGILKYINTDSMPLEKFDEFREDDKNSLKFEIKCFVDKINNSEG